MSGEPQTQIYEVRYCLEARIGKWQSSPQMETREQAELFLRGIKELGGDGYIRRLGTN